MNVIRLNVCTAAQMGLIARYVQYVIKLDKRRGITALMHLELYKSNRRLPFTLTDSHSH